MREDITRDAVDATRPETDRGNAPSGTAATQPYPTASTRPDRTADDREKIAADIEQTRHDLGRTLDALAAKMDVPSRVRDKVAQVREETAGKVATLAETVREKTRRQVPRVGGRLAIPSAKAHGVIPEPVRRAAARATRQAAQTVGARPVLLCPVGGLCVLAGLWIWRRGSR
jgi:Protein of unknown function (DUF3618)